MRREARLLRAKAVASLRQAATSFNSFNDQGRVTSTLLHFQHAFEMLLKAALANRGIRLFDPRTGKSIGFEKCVNLGRQHLGLSEEAAGTLRDIDALRDDEQHYLGSEDEGLLYVHARAAITLFDDLLQTEFAQAASTLTHCDIRSGYRCSGTA